MIGSLTPIGQGFLGTALAQLVQEKMGDLMKGLMPDPQIPAFHVQSSKEAMNVAKLLQLCAEGITITREGDDLVTTVRQSKKNITTDEAWEVYWEFSRRKAAAIQKANPVTELRTERGDSFWSMAAGYYGDPYYWLVLAQDNPHAKKLRPGMSIRVRPFSELTADHELVRKGESRWALTHGRMKGATIARRQPIAVRLGLDSRFIYPLQHLAKVQ